MAIKNIRIRPEGGNDFRDVLHPETNTGMVLDKDGNPMLHDYVRFPGYSIATGTNNYVASLNPAPLAYKEGMRIAIKIGSANTGKATLNINNLGAKPIVDPEGEELEAGDLLANRVYNLIYTGTVFQLLGKGGDNIELTGNALASQVLKGRTFYNTDPNNKLVGTMENNGNVSSTITITGSGKPTKAIPSGYTSGGTITAQLSSTLASSIKKGATIGGVTGTFDPRPSFAINSGQTIMNNRLRDGASVEQSVTFSNNIIIAFGYDSNDTQNISIYYDGLLVSQLYKDERGSIDIYKSSSKITIDNNTSAYIMWGIIVLSS